MENNQRAYNEKCTHWLTYEQVTKMINEISNQDIEAMRVQMLKFAQLQLKDEALAEDVVQEAFVSALKNLARFKRQSALKTWIFAILKNKIIDCLRANQRFVLATDLLEDDEENAFFDKGVWKQEYRPTALQDDENQVYSEQFWLLFETCLTRLPALQAKIFMMREYLELKTDEICQNEEISSANLHVLLYRARLQLQHCLTKSMRAV